MEQAEWVLLPKAVSEIWYAAASIGREIKK